MKEQNIEKVFRENLGNIEADVNANAWSRIQQGLQTPEKHSPTGSAAGKFGLSGYGYLLVMVAAVGLMTAVYFDTRKSSSEAENALATMPVKEISAPVASQTQTH